MVADGARFTTRFVGLLAILARHGSGSSSSFGLRVGYHRRDGANHPTRRLWSVLVGIAVGFGMH
jgi:hypothetical protein